MPVTQTDTTTALCPPTLPRVQAGENDTTHPARATGTTTNTATATATQTTQEGEKERGKTVMKDVNVNRAGKGWSAWG